MHLYENIKHLRRKMGLNQTQFGELIGINKASISGYEKGQNDPKLPVLIKMAQIFDVSIDDLLLKEMGSGKQTTTSSFGFVTNEEFEALKARVEALEKS